MHRVWRRYSSSTTGWISTSGKRRGVRRRGRNERLVLDVCRSFLCFPFLFLPSPTPLERHCTLPENFIYVEISRATASKPATRPDTSRRRPRHSPPPFSSLRLNHNTLNFLSSVNLLLSSPFTPFFPRSNVHFQRPCHPVTIFGQFFTGFEFPRSSFSFIFQPRMFPPPGKANKRVDRAAWRTRHADGNSSGNENT